MIERIAVVTGSRAEYGLLKPLIREFHEDPTIDLKLLVTGMHLMEEFGQTYREIKKDGFPIEAKVEDGLNGDSSIDIINAIAQAMEGFAKVLNQLHPDLLVVLGDRTEILAASIAAGIIGIPIAHIHGGETTEGAYDEFIRHSVTKMAHLHFASTEAYRKRIIQLGEHPDKVFNVGAIGIDSIKNLDLLSKQDFEKAIEFNLDRKAVLITFHPVTLEDSTAENQFNELLQALDTLEDTTLIFTKPNSDKDGRVLIRMIDGYVSNHSKKAIAFTSLGQLRYLSALKHVNFVIGNSSSGILEVPYFNIPTINIGDRQKGRIQSKSVINCEPERASILAAIKKCGSQDFLESIKSQEKIYGDGTATRKILSVLKDRKIEIKAKKKFYNL